ncbi:hypothetical protein HG530_012308 [Fusarium avenaceum]|nr:hypothetical protein HG530_012308 [Fusarium avenaceum]
MAVLVGSNLGLLVLLEGLAVVSDKHNQSLVRQAVLVKGLQQLAQPGIGKSHGVEVAVKVLVPLHLSVGLQVIGLLERLGNTPRMVVMNMRFECRLSEAEIVNLLKVVAILVIVLENLFRHHVLETDFLVKFLLSVVAVGDGLEKGGVPLLLQKVVRLLILLDLVEEVQDLGDTRLVAVCLRLLEAIDRHGPCATVDSSHTLE